MKARHSAYKATLAAAYFKVHGGRITKNRSKVDIVLHLRRNLHILFGEVGGGHHVGARQKARFKIILSVHSHSNKFNIRAPRFANKNAGRVLKKIDGRKTARLARYHQKNNT